MARYATNEQMCFCLQCEIEFAEREIVITKLMNGATGECCPRCTSIHIYIGTKQDYDNFPLIYI